MRKAVVIAIAATMFSALPARAQQTVKIGVILAYSGQFADPSAQMDNGIKLYLREHGDVVAGKRIELIRKDTGGIAPDVAKRLAQELIVRDNVDLLAGFALTPNALAAADVSAQAKKFMICEALKKTGGKTDSESLIAAAKEMQWESPRGTMSIDAETRDVVQTVYIRRVERVGGELRNVEFDKIEDVKDPFKARMKN
jgi:ABC-type branched-subunit amino acid transport system substrate-binding protein